MKLSLLGSEGIMSITLLTKYLLHFNDISMSSFIITGPFYNVLKIPKTLLIQEEKNFGITGNIVVVFKENQIILGK